MLSWSSLDGVLVGDSDGRLYRLFCPRWWQLRRWARWWLLRRFSRRCTGLMWVECAGRSRHLRAIEDKTVKLVIPGPDTVHLTQ